MSDDGREREHNAKAMEERHSHEQAVSGGVFHTLACGHAIVHNIEMREHDTFGEASRARGILHIGNILACDRLLARLEILLFDKSRAAEHLYGVIHAPLALWAKQDHVSQFWDAGAVDFLASRVILEFGDKFIEHIDIRGVAVLTDHAERVDVCISQKILKLTHLIVGVDGDEPRSNLGASEKDGEPIGNVVSPDADLHVLLNAKGHKALGELVHAGVKLRIAPIEATIGIGDEILVGCFARIFLEQTVKSILAQLHNKSRFLRY